MKREETTKERILRTLSTCFERSLSTEGFYGLLNHYGIQTYGQSGQVAGIILDGDRISLNALGYTPSEIEWLNPIIPNAEELGMIDDYHHQMEEQELALKASDIVPNWDRLEQEMERTDWREDELDEIRGNEEEKEIDEGLER